MAQVTRAVAQAAAEVVRTETTAKANTANRVGGLHRDTIDSVMWNNNGLAAARPGSGAFAGDTYFATDTSVLSFWDGASWQNFSASPVSGLTDARMVVADGTDDIATDNVALAAGVMNWATGTLALQRSGTGVLSADGTQNVLRDAGGAEALHLRAAFHAYDFSGDNYQNYSTTSHTLGWDGTSWVSMSAAGLVANAAVGDLTLQRQGDNVLVADGSTVGLYDQAGALAVAISSTEINWQGRPLVNALRLDLAADSPQINFLEGSGDATNPGADETRWRVVTNGGDLLFMTRTDANAFAQDSMVLRRSGAVMTSLELASGVRINALGNMVLRSGTSYDALIAQEAAGADRGLSLYAQGDANKRFFAGASSTILGFEGQNVMVIGASGVTINPAAGDTIAMQINAALQQTIDANGVTVATRIESPYFASSSADPADAGLVRGVNGSVLLAARNQANDGNVEVAEVDSSNGVKIAGGGVLDIDIGPDRLIGDNWWTYLEDVADPTTDAAHLAFYARSDWGAYVRGRNAGAIEPFTVNSEGETAAVFRTAHAKTFHRILGDSSNTNVWSVSIPNDSIVLVEGVLALIGATDANDNWRQAHTHGSRAFLMFSETTNEAVGFCFPASGQESGGAGTGWTINGAAIGSAGSFTFDVTVQAASGVLVAGWLKVRVFALDHTLGVG